MFGIEEAYCNTCIHALLQANYTLLESTVADALQNIHVQSKGDTLGLDAKPEIVIAESVKNFDQYATLLTEERGEDANPLAKTGPQGEFGPRTFFVSDPTDRSSQLKEFLEDSKNKSGSLTKVGDVLRGEDCRQQWEASYGDPCSITGAFSALTCVRRGLPICAVLLNYITQEMFVACSGGVLQIDLPPYEDIGAWQKLDFESCRAIGTAIQFRQVDAQHSRRFVTFLGKKGYSLNLLDSKLIRENELKSDLHFDLPGGPSRILYLSNLQPEDTAVGFIVANGEKIGEWIHWFPFIRFGSIASGMRGSPLRVFEIFQDRPWTKDGILMSTSPIYSILQRVDSHSNKMIVDVGRLKTYPNPSKYRGTFVVVPASNHLIVQLVQQYGHRAVEFLES